MKTNVVVQFTLLTLGITLLTWGGMVAFAQFGITSEYHPWLLVLMMLGGLSPTYVSYIVLKKNGEVSGFKEWLKTVFYAKSKPSHYFLAGLLVVLFFGTHIAVSGLAEVAPLYMFFAMLPVVFVGGGLEEAGWRYIFQPELDKKYGFVLSAIVTGIIWFVWHIPLFFIPGTSQYAAMDLWMFAVNVLGMTFFYGAIVRITGKAAVFLSILAHTLTNASFSAFLFYETWTGTMAAFAVMVGVSAILVLIHKQSHDHP